MTDDSSRECGGAVNQSSSMSNPDPSRAALADRLDARANQYQGYGISDDLKAAATVLRAHPSTRTCATCHAILADGPQPAAAYSALRDPLPPTLNSGADHDALRETVAWIIDEHAVDTVKMHGRVNASQRAVVACEIAFAKADKILALPRAVEGGAVDEGGWLIERADSPASAPKYWAAGMRDPETFSAWTSNHLQAIRFARKVDAEHVAERIMKETAVRIAEHGWSAPALLDEPLASDKFLKDFRSALSHPNTGDGK